MAPRGVLSGGFDVGAGLVYQLSARCSHRYQLSLAKPQGGQVMPLRDRALISFIA